MPHVREDHRVVQESCSVWHQIRRREDVREQQLPAGLQITPARAAAPKAGAGRGVLRRLMRAWCYCTEEISSFTFDVIFNLIESSMILWLFIDFLCYIHLLSNLVDYHIFLICQSKSLANILCTSLIVFLNSIKHLKLSRFIRKIVDCRGRWGNGGNARRLFFCRTNFVAKQPAFQLLQQMINDQLQIGDHHCHIH